MTQFKLSDFCYPKKLPWDEIFHDINRAGISPYQTSILIGESWSSTQRWARGTEPKHSIGIAILEVHSRYCGIELTEQRISEARKGNYSVPIGNERINRRI